MYTKIKYHFNIFSKLELLMKFFAALALLSAISMPDGYANILPPNNLHLEDSPQITSNISRSQFNKMIDKAEDFYTPIIESHGGKFIVNKYWSRSIVNATAEKDGDKWIVNMYGGMARRPEITKDAFMMVVCREIGHHLAGMPQYDEWASVEGQSDFFAAHVCAKNMWADEHERNSDFATEVHQVAKRKCDQIYTIEAERHICYRTTTAGARLAALLAYLSRNTLPSFHTPDQSVVKRTKRSHPAIQCRFDTYIAGALCSTRFDDFHIPGREGSRRDSELDQLKYSCSQTNPDHFFSARPKCWYKQRYDNSASN